jgi:hypothetical protein
MTDELVKFNFNDIKTFINDKGEEKKELKGLPLSIRMAEH